MSTTDIRTDIHRPSAMNPDEYVWVGCFYVGPNEGDMMAYRQENHRHAEFCRTAVDRGQQVWNDGNFRNKGTCDLCGAMFFHGAYFLHLPTGDIIHTGWDCAENVDIAAAEGEALRKNLIAQGKANATRVANIAYRATLLLAVPALRDAFYGPGHDRNEFIADVKVRFEGSAPDLSERQVLAVVKSAAKDHEFAARRAAEQATASPVVEGNGVIVEGVVVSTKNVEGYNGMVTKMLVRDDRGFKVWGTVPAALESRTDWDDEGQFVVLGAESGARVRFTANIEASNDDPTFGFFKRPRLATLVAPAPVES